MPQIVLRADKSFDWGALNARVLAHEKRSFAEIKRGFGFGIGGSYKITDKDLLMGQYTRVDSDIDQLYGSNGYAIDATTGAIAFDKNQGLVVGYAVPGRRSQRRHRASPAYTARRAWPRSVRASGQTLGAKLHEWESVATDERCRTNV